MRSLEEWQQYVEQQIEAARRRKSGVVEDTAEDAPAPAVATESVAEAPVEPQAAEASDPLPAEHRRLEGRALLSWEDTSPIQKPANRPTTAYVPPARDRLAPASEATAPPPILKDAIPAEEAPAPENQQPKAGASSAPPEAGRLSTPERSVRESRPTSTYPDEPEIVPLKPYQPKDPRWQSSVTPPRNLTSQIPPKWSVRSTPPTPAKEKAEESIAPPPLTEETVREEAAHAEVLLATEEMAALNEVVLPEAAPPETVEIVSALIVEVTSVPILEEAVSSAALEEENVSLPSAEPASRKRGKRAKRLTAKKAEALPSPLPETPEQLQALWNRVPRHVQALIRTQNDEIAQRSYKSFKESREELIGRLLDPELSLEEAARILAVCPTTVRRYTNRGLLPHHRTPGNQRRFRLSHVLEFTERFGQTLEGDQAKERTGDTDSDGSSSESSQPHPEAGSPSVPPS